jgi:hypothetical protein
VGQTQGPAFVAYGERESSTGDQCMQRTLTAELPMHSRRAKPRNGFIREGDPNLLPDCLLPCGDGIGQRFRGNVELTLRFDPRPRCPCILGSPRVDAASGRIRQRRPEYQPTSRPVSKLRLVSRL